MRKRLNHVTSKTLWVIMTLASVIIWHNSYSGQAQPLDKLVDNKKEYVESIETIESQIKPLDYDIIQAEKILLSNGMDLYFLADTELPILNIQLMIAKGSFDDPSGKEGLCDILAASWRQSGSQKYPGDELNDFFEFIGGSLEMTFDRQYGQISMSILSKHSQQAIQRLKDMLTNPLFLEEKIALARSMQLSSLKRNLDNPFFLAFRYLRRIAFAGTAYANSPTEGSLNSIARQDVTDSYFSFIRRDNAAWVISGDISKTDAIALVESLGLPRTTTKHNQNKTQTLDRHLQQNLADIGQGIFLIDKQIPQSTILYGGPGLRANDQQSYAYTVADFLLGGGGFNSRITREIRSNRGLAYSAGSITREYRDFGVFALYAQTKNESVAEVIDIMGVEMAKMRLQTVDDEELSWAKNSIINKFVFLFTNSQSIANRTYALDYDLMPSDYLDAYTQRIAAVSATEIQKISKRILKKESLPIFVVGPAVELKLRLTKKTDNKRKIVIIDTID